MNPEGRYSYTARSGGEAMAVFSKDPAQIRVPDQSRLLII